MLCAVASPTLRRRRLARELIRLRDAAGLTLDQAATAAGISPSHLSRVERARVGVRTPVVKVLLAAYGADEETTSYLVEIAKDAAQQGWWHKYVGAIPEKYATYIGFEAEADQIWSFDPSTMPGLLQTEDYARAMFQGGASRFSQEEVDRQVEVRLRRQQLLTRASPPRVWVVLDEAVIRRQVGGPGTLAAQLQHLVDLAAVPHLDIQVVPFAVGAHPGTPGSFIVLRFAEPTDPPVVFVETMAGGLYPESQEQIDGAILAFDRLRAIALSPDDSVALIRRAARELR
jgi:transcriptional regulator with XRE-family HTH domain